MESLSLATQPYRDWKRLKTELIAQRFPMLETERPTDLGFYELVYAAVDEQGQPKLFQAGPEDTPSFLAFTHPDFLERMEQARSESSLLMGNKSWPAHAFSKQFCLKPFMLGDLTTGFNQTKQITPVKVNPIRLGTNNGEITVAEEILIAPIYDEVTKKYMLTDPDEALALLAIRPEDQERMGMEMVFYSITNKSLPEEKESRERELRERIEQLSFYAPRVPLRKGSASVLCVLLNLENAMEEVAFIRSYKTLDRYSDILFVTSSLEILTGELESIPYDGEQIDTIFMPIIEWQKNRRRPSLKAGPSLNETERSLQ